MKPKHTIRSTKRPQESAILQCPSCHSHRAVILNTRPLSARCADCSRAYNIEYESPQPWKDQTEEPEQELPKKNHKTQADARAEITPVPPPKPGFNTAILEDAIAAGPAGIRKAQKIALRRAKQFQEEATDHWRQETDWLKNSDGSYRAHARYALVWRPRFLAALSMCHSVQLACRYVRVSPDTAYYHRSHDRQFAEQWDEARDHGIELLHARTFQRALEGDCEPIFYMGIPCGYIRKYSDKLQIELLRAYKPDTFKTPGTQVNIGSKSDIFVLTEEQRHELQRINREYLLTTPIPTDSVAASSSKELRNENPETRDQTP